LHSIRAWEYGSAFEEHPHVFLLGDLRRPAPHPFFRDERVELVLCEYEAGADGELHWHGEVTEYEIVLSGRVGYFRVETGETTWLEAGDVSVVAAGECVKRLVPVPARTLAVKVPSRPQDKVLCTACARSCAYRIAAHAGVRS
jgi:mannose-6-phosphate isomerase-like protein (cupin superfamily)